jgi:hypothetical protein
LFFVFGTLLVLFAGPVIYWLTRDGVFAGLVLVCSLLFTLLSQFDKIEELALGGLKARLRATIQETAATLKQLRELAAISTSSQLASLIGSSFLQGMPDETRYRLASDFLSNAKSLDFNKDEMASITEPWRKGVSYVYVREIGRLMFKNLSTVTEDWSSWQRLGDFNTWSAPSPSEVRGFLDSSSLKGGPEVEALLRDYEVFLDRKDGEIPNLHRLIECLSRQDRS